jgi:mRNA interferase RelE/StbE
VLPNGREQTMKRLDVTRDAYKFLEDLKMAKQFRQVTMKLLALLADPQPADAEKLRGYDYYRVDVGEYRIVYRYDDTTVYIIVVAKRNDDEVYKQLARKE